MMINTSKSSKGFTICLAFNIIIILTVTCNYTLANNQNNHRGRDNEIQEIDSDSLKKIVSNNNFVDMLQYGIKMTIPRIPIETKDEFMFEDYFVVDRIHVYERCVRFSKIYYKTFIVGAYSANVFNYLRYLFKITNEDYIASVCNTRLIGIPNSGASASIFYFTEDGKFIIKSLQETEFIVFLQMQIRYKSHVKENRSTLLPKISGFYCFKSTREGIRLITMNNLLPSGIKIHQKYDLKGSTYNRTSRNGKNTNISSTLKDLDFIADYPGGLRLMPYTFSKLLKTLGIDCDFLRGLNLMDYSLLMGVHKIDEDKSSTCYNEASARWKRLMADSIGMEGIQANPEYFPGENCPSLKGSIPAESESGEKLLLFVGIIDILQEYRLTKKIEHTLKHIFQSSSISVQDPFVYETRLFEFLRNSVFKRRLLPEERGKQPMK